MLEHTKRYMLIHETWNMAYNDNIPEKVTRDEYDTLEELNQDIEMLHTWYMKPGCKFYWGYVALDFEEQKVLKVGHDGVRFNHGERLRVYKDFNDLHNIANLEFMDYAFRKDGEVPEGYCWKSMAEYRGWLQFRWGDHKNAVTYTTDEAGNRVKECPPPIENLIDGHMYIDRKTKPKPNKKKLPNNIKDDEIPETSKHALK